MRRIAAAWGLWALLASAAGAEVIPLEEKAKFDRALEDKAEAVIERILGPGMAKVTVDATIDFSSFESVKLERSAAEPEKGSEKVQFLWENVDEIRQKGFPSRVLPGIPFVGSGADAVAAGSQNYERSVQYPSGYVKRLAATLILDESVPEDRGAAIEGTLRNVLDLQEERGDTLKVLRMRFSTPWQNLWRTADSAWLMLKYGSLLGLSLVALLVVGYCFIRLASAMSEMARLQLHQLQMEAPRAPELGQLERLSGLIEGPEEERPAPRPGAVEAEAELELRPEHLEGLPVLLTAEENAELATAILFQLSPEQAAKVLSLLPEARRRELVLKISETVQLDPAVVGDARERLRVFVQSYVAGHRRLQETLSLLSEDVQGKVIRQIQGVQPNLAKDLRKALLRFEDLAQAAPEDLAEIGARAPAERLSLALRGVEEELQQALLAALPDAKRQAVEEQLRNTPPQPLSRVQQARRDVVELWKKLAQEGRVAGAGAAAEPLI